MQMVEGKHSLQEYVTRTTARIREEQSENPSISPREMFALHLSQWHHCKDLIYVNNQLTSETTVTFQAIACAWGTSRLEESCTTLRGLDMLGLPDHFVHEGFQDVPIARWPLSTTVSAIHGLYWITCCDPVRSQASPQFIIQSKLFCSLLVERIFFLCSTELPGDVLNMQASRRLVPVNDQEPSSGEPCEHASMMDDTEAQLDGLMKRLDKIKETGEARETTPEEMFAVKADFVFEMDTFVSTMLHMWFKGTSTPSIVHISAASSIQSLRNMLFVAMRGMRQSAPKRAWAWWYEELVVHEGYVRIYQKRHGKDIKFVKRQVILEMNPPALLTYPVTDEAVVRPRPLQDQEAQMLFTTDAFLAFHAREMKENMCVKLMKSGVITRDYWRGVWVCMDKAFASFTHAFVFLREQDPSQTIIHGTDVTGYDTWLTLA